MGAAGDIGVVRVVNRVMGTNTYICPTGASGRCLLVDPGVDREAVERALATTGLAPVAIVLTHGHFDHLGSADHFRRRFAAPVLLNAADILINRQPGIHLIGIKRRGAEIRTGITRKIPG